MQSLRDNTRAVVDLGIVLMVGISFAALMVIGFLIYEVKDSLNLVTNSSADLSIANITSGWNDAVALLLVAITIFILAIAISALLMLRGR